MSNIKRSLISKIVIIITFCFVLYLLLPTAISDWTTEGPTWENTTFDNTTTNWDDNGEITLLSLYSDEYNTGSLDTSKWWWVRENSGAWIMGDTYIQINSTNTDMYEGTQTAPILLQNISNEDMTIITNISSTPDADYEGGGLIFYADDDNFVSFMYFYENGNRAFILKKEDNNVQAYNISDPISPADPIYLKLVKNNNDYLAYYSDDRATWTYFDSYSITDTMTDVGLTAYSASSADPEPFKFDWFMTSNFTRNGNVTVSHNAGASNVVSGYNIQLTTPTNTNISLTYADNDTSAERELGLGIPANDGWINGTISGDLYQYADLILTLYGNSTLTPIIESVTLQTSSTTIADPTNLTNTTGDFWVNYTWNITSDADYTEVMIHEE